MVELNKNDSQTRIVITANRSMSWETNKKILAFMFLVNMVIALSWTAMGAWMVLPFAGLEILLVGIGMYYVSWKLSFKEILLFEAESLIVQKGVYYPKQEWHWGVTQTTLIKRPSKYRLSAPTLFLEHQNHRIEIGEALNRSEKKQLREHLISLGLTMRVISTQ